MTSPSVKHETGGYSPVSLINDWYAATVLQKKDKSIANWELLKSNEGSMFIYVADDVAAPPRTIHVRDDMSIELRVSGQLASFPIYGKAKCFNDVREVLQTVPYFNICIGSDGKGDCSQVYFVRKPHSSSERCSNCQTKHRKEHDKKKKREIRLQKKIAKEAKTKKNMKQTIKRRDKKISSLKTKIQNLIKK